MCPLGGSLLGGRGGRGGPSARGRMPAHCLLVETPASGLVLVDTGFGAKDVEDPQVRLGAFFTALAGPPRDPAITARAQIRALGFDPDDVRHVVVTHLDLDHAGGLPDFPRARVHVHRDERAAALAPTLAERQRYRPAHFAHRPDFAPYDAAGEPWKGFPAVRDLPGLPPEILAIPLPGHTRGHACVAVDRGDRWLLHAGDAYFHHASVRPGAGAAPPGLRVFERLVAVDYARVLDNHARLRELARAPDVTVFSAHDPEELDTLRAGATVAPRAEARAAG